VLCSVRVCNESHSAIANAREECAKTHNVLEILIYLYILNAVYPDNGDYPWHL
jgi:hypothetical protein